MKRILAFSLLLCMLAGMLPVAAAAADNTDEIEKILSEMTTEQKIAQTLMVDFSYWNGEAMTVLPAELGDAIAGYGFGGVILFSPNIVSAEQTRELTSALQNVMSANGKLPLFIATDQEGGSISRIPFGTNLPGNMALAATGSSDNARIAGEITGSELNALGINTCLAPCLDVQSNANNSVIGLRSFSDNPLTVVEYGMAFAEGLAQTGTISCAKHYPGHGSSTADSHYTLPYVNSDYDSLTQTELPPFAAAASNGTDMIMTAHIVYPGLDNTKLYSYKTGLLEPRPATLSQRIITEILKGEFGFEGVVITDAMNMLGITNSFSEVQAVTEALCAGNDMVCMPCSGVNYIGAFSRADAIIFGVKEAVESGYLPEERLNDAVSRIISLKLSKGLIDGIPQHDISVVGSEEHAALEREIAAKAITVVENNACLPMKVNEGETVLVFCPSNDMAAQIVLAKHRAAAAGLFPESADIMVYTFTQNDYFATGYLKDCIDLADKVIVLSQMTGIAAMSFMDWRTAGAANIVDYSSRLGKTCVVVSIEQPYDVQLYPKASAVLAVFGAKGSSMDVTEAFMSDVQSVTGSGPNIIAGLEVIFGIYPAQGRLPVSIPVYNSGSRSFTQELIYPRGWGEDYRAFKHY